MLRINDSIENLCSILNYPGIHIVTLIGHYKTEGFKRVQNEDGEDLIDEFGSYVYIKCELGTTADVDMRYSGEMEPELFHLQYIENDIPHREANRVAG